MVAIEKSVAMVILAAGNSTRMGEVKQLLPWRDTNLLQHTIQEGLKSKVQQVFVVLGANRELILRHEWSSDIRMIRHPEWENGMGTSLAISVVEVLKDSDQIDAVLFALSDQPLIDYKHYNKLINSYIKYDQISATSFDKALGVPAVFPKRFFKYLSQLKGDQGAKSVILNHMNEVNLIREDRAGIDLDTFENYLDCYNRFGRPG